MSSLHRLLLPSHIAQVAPDTLWRAALLLAGSAAWLVVRSCGFEWGTLAAYLAYLGLYVVLPGVVVMRWVNGGPLSLAGLLALAVPTGFAVEILVFLGCSALGARSLHAWMPVLWIGLLALPWLRTRTGPVRWRVTGHHAGMAVGLAAAFLGMTLLAVSQMFAEAPLTAGLPAQSIFHDWVYLISRAGVIKNNWPLDDPSLAGTPLQYHYFMLVHAAAASLTAGLEIGEVLLRLVYVPLGAVLVAQAYVLGRAVARTPWGGVVAALLMVALSEVSFAPSYGEPLFLGLFARWLFVSPTFFFGMMYCGALLLAVHWCVRRRHCGIRHFAWLALLGTAGSGAKGTLLPVLLGALGLWALWRWWREGRLPWRLVIMAACLGGAFALVYLQTMSAWRTGDARLNLFHVFQLTGFWKQHVGGWTEALAAVLPRSLAAPLAQVACAAVVFAGTAGVRLLAIPYLVSGDLERRDAQLVGWLGAFFATSVGMGLLLELNSYGELYVILMMRLPMAALTAGFVVATGRRVAAWRRGAREGRASASPFEHPVVVAAGGVTPPTLWRTRLLLGMGGVVLAGVLVTQASLWWTRNRPGLARWLDTPVDLAPEAPMRQLQEAMLWVRRNTEPNAVLVANAVTPENMRKDHWGALDRTLMGVHFYYSALSERRLWFEGPNYVLNGPLLSRRAALASDFFYRGGRLEAEVVSGAPCYVLLDRSLNDGASVTLPLGARLFANDRMVVYRLSAPPPVAYAPAAGAEGAEGDS